MDNHNDRLELTLEIEDCEMTDKGVKIVIAGGVGFLVLKSLFGATQLRESVPFRVLITEYANRNNVSPCLVAAVIKKESDFDPTAVNPSDPSYGLGQITLPTANQFREGTTKLDLFDPEINIKIMCQFISWLSKRGATMPGAISAYNTGLAGWQAGHTPNPPNYSAIVKGFMEDLCS